MMDTFFRDGNDTCPVEDIKKVTAAGGKIDLNLKRTVLEIFLRLAFVIFFFFFGKPLLHYNTSFV